MTTEITRKQAVLLSVLGVVLVVVLFVQLLIRPLMTKVSEAKEQLEVCLLYTSPSPRDA